jgi:hypothetical protein
VLIMIDKSASDIVCEGMENEARDSKTLRLVGVLLLLRNDEHQ